MAEDKLLQQKEALERMKGELARLNEAFDRRRRLSASKGIFPRPKTKRFRPRFAKRSKRASSALRKRAARP